MSNANEPGQGKPIAIQSNSLAREQARTALVHLLHPGDALRSTLDPGLLSAGQWDDILQQAQEYQVQGLLYRSAKQGGVNPQIPAEVVASLRRSYLFSVSRSTRMYRILGKILRTLKETGVEVIVLKGAFLAEAVYGDTALRLMTDLDLLVRHEDTARAGSVLLGLGFRADEEENVEHGERNAHHRYFLSDERVFVEVHWSIDESPSPFNIDIEGLWARAQDAMIAGVQTKALCPEDLVLHLCLHASFRHLFGDNGVRSMCDIAETISHYDGCLAWDEVRRRSREWGTDTWLFLALYFAERIVGARVPQSILKQVEPIGLDAHLLAVCERRLLGSGIERTLISDNWGRVQTGRGMKARLGALLETAFPPRERVAEIYSLPAGSWRVWLYYPVRLGHLLRQHGPIAWRFWRADVETLLWMEGETNRAELETVKRMMLRSTGAPDS